MSLDRLRERIFKYPTVSLVLFVLIALILAPFFFNLPNRGEPNFILMLFAAGAYTVVSVVRGFRSIFGRSFRASPARLRFQTVALSLVLLVPCLGIAAFVVVSAMEAIDQLRCIGAGCAQGGIATMVYVVVAWVSYSFVIGLSRLFKFLGWWPAGIAPNFCGKNNRG